MKTTFKMSILALSLGLMTVVSSCGEKKSADAGVDTSKTVIEPKVDTAAMAPMDTTSTSTTTTTTEVKK